MGITTRIQLDTADNWNDAPTQEELDSVPAMSRKEMVEVMRSSEYRESAKCRALIAESLRRHGLQEKPQTGIDGRPLEHEQEQTGDAIVAKRQAITNMMRDPRYKSDASYRIEVQSKLAALTANDGTIGAKDLITPNTSVSLGVSSSPHHGCDLRVRKFQRIELGAKETGPDTPVKSAPVKEAFAE